MTPRDLTAARFGRLVVTGRARRRDAHGALWLVRCDCGRGPMMVRASSLTCGDTRSCGCLAVENARAQLAAMRERRSA